MSLFSFSMYLSKIQKIVQKSILSKASPERGRDQLTRKSVIFCGGGCDWVLNSSRFRFRTGFFSPLDDARECDRLLAVAPLFGLFTTPPAPPVPGKRWSLLLLFDPDDADAAAASITAATSLSRSAPPPPPPPTLMFEMLDESLLLFADED